MDAAAEVKPVEPSSEKLLLVNEPGGTAFAMQFVESKRLVFHQILGAQEAVGPIKVFRHTVETAVRDALFMRDLSIRILHDGEIEEDRLEEAKLRLCIDDEVMIDGQSLLSFYRTDGKVVLPLDGKGLFFAVKLTEDGEADQNDKLGYMLPNGTIIDATLEGTPRVEYPFTIEISFWLGLYTTKLPEMAP